MMTNNTDPAREATVEILREEFEPYTICGKCGECYFCQAVRIQIRAIRKPDTVTKLQLVMAEMKDKLTRWSGRLLNGREMHILVQSVERGYEAGIRDAREEWVAVEDRLPKRDGRYFVRVKENFGGAYGAYYWPLFKRWDIDVGYGLTVIAWMPIPPYGGNDER